MADYQIVNSYSRGNTVVLGNFLIYSATDPIICVNTVPVDQNYNQSDIYFIDETQQSVSSSQ
jgi:hypothetical protein